MPLPPISLIRYDHDNLAWMATLESGALVIDPGSARAVEAALSRAQKRPIAFLCTHGHSDHTSGLAALAARYPEAGIAAHPAFLQTFQNKTRALSCRDGETFSFGNCTVRCIETPGHTSDSVCFYLAHAKSGSVHSARGALFTGDTLFAMGCGRVGGDDYGAMFASLARIAGLPPETLVCPGHDYLDDNLRFARSLTSAPHDPAFFKERENARAREKEPPTTLAIELEGNPFLRLARIVSERGDVPGREEQNGDAAFKEFAHIRKRKNAFI